MENTAFIGIDPEAPITQGQAMLLLEEMKGIKDLLQKQVDNKPENVSVKEFSKLTGMGASTVSLYINQRKIQASKPGEGKTSKWRIPYSEVERFNKVPG